MATFEKFENLIQEIISNPNLEIINNNLEEIRNYEPFIFEESVERSQELMGEEIAAELFQNEKSNMLRIEWVDASGMSDRFLRGGFEIQGMTSAFYEPSEFWEEYNGDSRFWRTEHQNDAKAVYEEFLPKLGSFQTTAPAGFNNGDGTHGCILCEKDAYPRSVYFFDSGFGLR